MITVLPYKRSYLWFNFIKNNIRPSCSFCIYSWPLEHLTFNCCHWLEDGLIYQVRLCGWQHYIYKPQKWFKIFFLLCVKMIRLSLSLFFSLIQSDIRAILYDHYLLIMWISIRQLNCTIQNSKIRTSYKTHWMLNLSFDYILFFTS